MLDWKFLPQVFELIYFEGPGQTGQTGSDWPLRSELERGDEFESVHSDGEVILQVLWHYPHRSNEFTLQRFGNHVTIISLEVMNDYGQLPLKL